MVLVKVKRGVLMLCLLVMCISVVHADDAPLRLAVAGVTHGHLGEVVRRIRRGDFEIVGVAEPRSEYRTKNDLTGRLAPNLFYADLGQMLDETHPEVVVAYGSIYDHLAVVEACAPRGIHVMVEKPLAVNNRDARRIARLAEKYGIKVLTNYETTWYSTNQHARRLIEEGKIGTPLRINIYDGHQGPKEIGCSPMFLEWLTDPVLNGGGAVVDFGCYGANLATWLLNGQEPLSVYAVLAQRKPDVYPRVDDDATIVVEYPGCTVQIMASWCWPTNRKDMYVYGIKGSVFQLTPTRMETRINGHDSGVFDAPELEAPYNDSFRFLRAVLRGEITLPPYDLSSLENNLMVVRILDAARRSARTGKPVKF
ncbi:MAG: Gfo/Idh/MocA family oxidoreductase [Bacteroidaceae bacterium]|nr:Gfo/Idh/MocA family oxidoreductase [Bacteroidaceae bacterium]